MNEQDREGLTALAVALFARSLPAVRACIDGGRCGAADIHTRSVLALVTNTRLCCSHMRLPIAGSPYLHVLLHISGVQGSAKFVDEAFPVLLEAGCSLADTDDKGRTSLHIAARNGLAGGEGSVADAITKAIIGGTVSVADADVL